VAVEFQFYILSPLLLWAVYSPARREPRRWCRPSLAVASLLGVAINLIAMLVQGESAFTVFYTWPVSGF